MTSVVPCSNSRGRNRCLDTGPQQEQARGRPEVGWHRGPVSWSRESVPTFCPHANREQEPPCCVCLSAVCRAHDRVPFRCGPGSLHHPASSPCRWRCVGRVGTLVLGLTRGWYTGCARTGSRFLYVVYPTLLLKDSIRLNLTLPVSRWHMRNLTLDRMDVQNRWFHPTFYAQYGDESYVVTSTRRKSASRSTSSRCTVGGVVSSSSCPSRSWKLWRQAPT